MQSLSEGPRAGMYPEIVSAILTHDEVEVSAGLELVDSQGRVLEDLSDDLLDGEVSRENYATVHGSASLSLSRRLVWGRDRVRPYMTLRSALGSARFNLGVYVLTTPETVTGEDPVTYEVEGFDLLHLLQDGPGDTYVLEPPDGRNFALGKPVTMDTQGGGGVGGPLALVTDGDASDPYSYAWTDPGPASVTVDLEEVVTLDRVVVWHYFEDARTYYDTKTEVSADGVEWTTVFDSATEGEYAESAAGHTITFDPRPVRYIRDSANGSAINPGDHWVEIQAFRDSPLTYIEAVRQVIADSGIGAPVRLDGTLQETPLVAPMVWALHEEPVSWLRIVNDLLSEINYRGLWADQDGTLRSGPYLAPAFRAEEWHFDTTDERTVLLGEDWKVTEDVFDAPNHWRFVRKGMTTEPVEGDGVYTVVNQASGPASIMELGRTRRKVVLLDAADQAALVAQGDRIVAEDQAVTREFEVEVDPLPIAGHFDVVRLTSEGKTEKCQVTSWTLPLDGSRGRWSMEAV